MALLRCSGRAAGRPPPKVRIALPVPPVRCRQVRAIQTTASHHCASGLCPTRPAQCFVFAGAPISGPLSPGASEMEKIIKTADETKIVLVDGTDAKKDPYSSDICRSNSTLTNNRWRTDRLFKEDAQI